MKFQINNINKLIYKRRFSSEIPVTTDSEFESINLNLNSKPVITNKSDFVSFKMAYIIPETKPYNANIEQEIIVFLKDHLSKLTFDTSKKYITHLTLVFGLSKPKFMSSANEKAFLNFMDKANAFYEDLRLIEKFREYNHMRKYAKLIMKQAASMNQTYNFDNKSVTDPISIKTTLMNAFQEKVCSEFPNFDCKLTLLIKPIHKTKFDDNVVFINLSSKEVFDTLKNKAITQASLRKKTEKNLLNINTDNHDQKD